MRARAAHRREPRAGSRQPCVRQRGRLKVLFVQAYIGARPKWFELVAAGKMEEAAEWRAKTTTVTGGATVKGLTSLMDLQVKDATAKSKTLVEGLLKPVWIIAALLAVAMTVGIVMVVLITRSILGPLSRANAMMDNIASGEGDLTRRLEQGGRDELGALSGSFHRFMDTLQPLVAQIKSDAGSVGEAAARVASAASDVSSSAREQSEAGAATAASVEQVTVSIGQVADSTRETAAITEQASTLARDGRSRADTTSQEILAAERSINDSAVQIEQLSQRSDQISSIVQVIREIAEQTNLLALNAAIEAARAGEQGRGFAVVADEVRKLAERTSASTVEIGSTIQAIQTEVRSAVEQLGTSREAVQRSVRMTTETAEALGQINDGAQSTSARVADIAAAAGEQRIASQDIARNIERIAQMAEQSTTTIAGAESDARRLAELADTLRGRVGAFKV